MKPAGDDDPLWLNSPVKRIVFRAVCYALMVMAGALLGWLAGGPWGMLATGTAMLVILISARGWVERSLGEIWRRSVQTAAAPQQGRHYAFAGVSFEVHDDGRECWMDEKAVRALLGLQKDRALKARFPNQWREATELGLRGLQMWIKVSALVHHLAEAPERMDPKRVRLRVYLDRDVLQPAARRRERGG